MDTVNQFSFSKYQSVTTYSIFEVPSPTPASLSWLSHCFELLTIWLQCHKKKLLSLIWLQHLSGSTSLASKLWKVNEGKNIS